MGLGAGVRKSNERRQNYQKSAHQSPFQERFLRSHTLLHGLYLARLRPVDPRERWQTLQSHLSAARGALAARDKAKALEHIEAALLIDPEFLAARMLRERVTSTTQDISSTPSGAESINLIERPARASAPAASASESALPVAVSPETLASFEARVMRRVREREATASRVAPTQRARRTWTVPFAAAAGFLAAMSSTALYEPAVLSSRNIAMSARLISLDAPPPLIETIAPRNEADVAPAEPPPVRPASTSVAVTGIVDIPPEPVRMPPPSQAAAASPPPAPQPPPSQPAPPPATSTVARVVPAPSRPTPDVVAATPTPAPAVVPAALVTTTDDRMLVDQTLQRYRRAYNRLDARSAQAVYPAVNEHALARAFDDLESQVLLFESCEIDVRGSAATVICRGSSHYVPKIGNHETRVERRVWSFTLRKDDGDWKIENARAAR
jgi:hypothetical protein